MTVIPATAYHDVLEGRILTLHDQLNEAQQAATIAQIELERERSERVELDAALATTLRECDALRGQLNTLSLIYHSDHTALQMATAAYQRLVRVCRDIADSYGNNAVDFHRAVARLKQNLTNDHATAQE